uniref:Succinic semialdehyde reductase isofom2 n=1 Tax=Solanum tuberosum TaxID=4113 RepID=M1AMY5_SOLTU
MVPQGVLLSVNGADALPASIGFLGLGIMGNPMAQNLIKAGCDVTVWNRTKSKCEPLISLGAKWMLLLENMELQKEWIQVKGLNVYNASSSNGQSSQEDNQAYDEDESGDDSHSVNDSGSAHDSDSVNESED